MKSYPLLPDQLGKYEYVRCRNLTGDLTIVGNFFTDPDITFIVDGERGNVVADNVAFTPDAIPNGARRVIDEAGPRA